MLLAACLASTMFLVSADPKEPKKANLTDAAKPGEVNQFEIKMQLAGERIFDQDGQPKTQKVTASAEHKFVEKTLAVNEKTGLASKAARSYTTAIGTVAIDKPVTRLLPSDRSVTIAQRGDDSTFTTYSLGGPLNREELEIVAEHFDTLSLSGLLPGKEVAVGEVWRLNNAAVIGLCQFESLAVHDLNGALESVEKNNAQFTITGTAQGIELGATVELTVKATGTYDLETHQITSLEWKQKDGRAQGPANPGFKADVVINVTRKSATEPKELADSALASVSKGLDAPASLLAIRYVDPKGQFEVSHAREWMFNGRTDHHAVFRLMDRGDYVAQATVTPWKKAEPGQHMNEQSFRKEMLASGEFQADDVLQEGEVKIGRSGWYVFRLSAQGTTSGMKTVQTFYLIAGPGGEQAVVAFTMADTQRAKLEPRDLAFVEGLSFGVK